MVASSRPSSPYKAIFDDAPDGMLVVSNDGGLLDANPRACALLGYARDELLEAGLVAVAVASDPGWERVLSCPGESRVLGFVRRDGGVFRARIISTGAADSGGTLGLIFGIPETPDHPAPEEDVAAQQRGAGAALRESEGRYRTLVEQTNEGVYLVDAQSLRVLTTNAAFQETLGYGPEELRGLTLYDIVAHDRKTVAENIRRTLQEGRHRVGERKYRRKDGSLAEVEVHASVVPYGGKDALCILAEDLTGRKRTEENLRRSLGVLLALREAGQILGSTLETEEIVTRLLTIMRGVSGLTAAVISVEDELGQPRIWREVGLGGLWRRARYAPQAEKARRMVLDVGEHRLFRLQDPEGTEELVGLCLPLRMKDRIAGVLEAYGPESLADEDAVEILRSLAAQAASALENAKLYGELAEREKRLADLIGQLFTAQEEERRRVAYEVHDGLAQIAAAAHQHLQGFANFYPPNSEEGRELLSQVLELVQRTVQEARRVIANLRPTVLDDFGIGKALRIEADRLRSEGYRVDYESNLGAVERLPSAVETALFRIAQEALANVRRHSGTDRARVTLDNLGDRARLCVRDWGRGFDPSAPRVGGGPGERVGLSSMQERVALLGGTLEVQSRPGVGTVVTVEVPLSAGAPGGTGAPFEGAAAFERTENP